MSLTHLDPPTFQPAAGRPPLLGASSFAWTWGVGVESDPPSQPLDEHALVRAAAELGCEVLQLADNTRVATRTTSELAALRAAAAGRSLQLEVGGRGLTIENVERHAAVAAALGAERLRFVIDAPGHEPAAGDVIAIVNAALPALTARGVTLALENHDRFAAAELAAIVGAVADAHVGICLDTANSFGAGEDLGTVLRELAPLTVELHVKDVTITRRPHGLGFEIRGARLGDGVLDLDHALATVLRLGRCAAVLLEQWAPEAPTADAAAALEDEWLVASIPVLRRALAAAGPVPAQQGEQ